MINRTVLMSGPDYFGIADINPYANGTGPVDLEKVKVEFAAIQSALTEAGIKIIQIEAPQNCQDGIFTANWGLCRNDKVVLSSLPGPRQGEQPYAEQTLKSLGKQTIRAPYNFSGQGDALPCGNYLFAGSGYRTDPRMHELLANELGYQVISLQTVPERDQAGQPVINAVSGWPDSFFYDIDLSISVLHENLIAWCPEAFEPDSQQKIRDLPLEKIEVDLTEATDGFACNLVSTGETVVMSNKAPKLQAAIEAKGFRALTADLSELRKNGGGIRCTTLTLDNS